MVSPIVSMQFMMYGKQSARNADRQAGKGVRKKRMLFCNETDKGKCPDLKGCRLPIGAESRERIGKV